MDEEIKKILDNHEKRIRALEGNDTVKEKNIKNQSIKEFLLSKKPDNDIEKTAICGYYLEHMRKQDGFTTKDLLGIFKEAKEVPPENISDKVYKLTGKGWMMEIKNDGTKKAYIMTNNGDKAVSAGFGKTK